MNGNFTVKHLQGLFRIFAILLGALLLWNHRFELYPDGISYLDVADSFIDKGWQGLVHSYWSPLYPVLLAILKLLFHPSPYWLVPMMQVMNFILFLVLVFSFDLFLTELVAFTKTAFGGDKRLPEWAVVSVGYSLFVWSVLTLAEIWKQTPDSIVAICFYLISCFVLRNKTKPLGITSWVLVGIVCGIGFWAKSIMLLLEILYLLMLAICLRQGVVKTAAALLTIIFASGVFILPFVVTLSLKQGYFTVGDSGKLNYAWYVNGVKQFTHWQGECPASKGKVTNKRRECPEIGKPIHSTRRINISPALYEFDKPTGGTYAPWFDPVYWHAGVTPYFDLAGHFWALKKWKADDKKTFLFDLSGGLFVLLCFLILSYVAGDLKTYFKRLSMVIDLFIPPFIILFIAYFVNFNTRYVGHFVVLFWLLLLVSISITPSREVLRLIKILVVLVLCIPLTSGTSIMKDFVNDMKTKPFHNHFLVANHLKSSGIKAGDKVVHFGNSWWAAWAKLLDVRIIAEISCKKHTQGPFWNLSKAKMDQIISIIKKKTNASIIVSQKAPAKIAKPLGWQNIPQTTYYVYDLRN